MEFVERQAWCQPAVLLALVLAVAVSIPGTWAVECAILSVLAGLAWWLSRGRRSPRLAAVATVAAVLSLAWGVRSSPAAPAVWPFAVEGYSTGDGTVVAEAPLGRQGTAPFRLRIETVRTERWAGRARAEVTVLGYRGASPATGSTWTWSGLVKPDGLVWKAGRQTGWAAPWWQARAEVRRGLTDALERLGPAPAALALALLIGATDDLTPWEKESFRLAGSSHVLALSGMHLSLLAVLLGAALHRRASPVFVFIGVQCALALFCLLAGPIPSLWRAWAMALLAGLWSLAKRPVPLRELLAQSYVATVLLWPDLAHTLSLELSFLAMAGLFWWSRRWEWVLRPWLGRWAAANLAASAAALAATVPLTFSLFGEVRWIGLVAAPPLVALTTIVLFGAAGVAALSFVPGFDLAWLAPVFQTLYDLTFTVTGWAGRAPPLTGVPLLVIAAGGLGIAGVFHYKRRSRRTPLPVSLNYDSPSALQAFLDSQGFNALKRWGQNFLINPGARRQILDALDLAPGEAVWEVGPGLGALTHHLVAAGHPITAFEIDPGYSAFLRREFGDAPGFRLVEGDVLKTWHGESPAGVKTVGNLPYNAASAIVADFVERGFFPKVFVVTVQLEMAQRMGSAPGNKNYSSFSVLCQSVFQVEEVLTLKPGSFYPAPEVTSRVVRLRPHGRYPGLDHRRFSILVRECFSSRRKTLRNNLGGAASALNVSDDALKAAFASAGVDLGLRAETLPVALFVEVYRALTRA